MKNRLRIFVFILLINATLSSSTSSKKKSDEECKNDVEKSSTMRLKKYLFCEYDKRERMTLNYNDSITYIEFKMAPTVANFNEDSGNLQLLTWFSATWYDEHLKWEPSSFENVTGLNVHTRQVWIPDMAVLSAGNEDSNEYGLLDTVCPLLHTGMLVCTAKVRYTIRCHTDFTHWPYDRQNCTLVFSLWSQIQKDIRIIGMPNSTLTMHYFVSSAEWRLGVSRIFYDDRVSNFLKNATSSRLSIDFILDRVHNQLSGRYVSPVIIVVIMTLTTLWLDPRSTERLAVACFNPVIHLFCIQDLHWALPHNGSTAPGLLVFYADSLVLATIALLLTFLLGKMQQAKFPPPRWISSSTARILRSKAGQIMLLSMLDPKVAAEIEPDAIDAGDLVRSDTKEPAWNYFVVLCSWIAFISFSFVYAILYAVLIPNSSMRAPIPNIVYHGQYKH